MDERDFNLPDYVQMIDEVKQELEQEREKIEEKTKLVDWAKQYLKGAQQELYNLHLDMKKLQEELSKQQKENESLKQQLIEERERRAMREMELAEMSKLSAGMAKKSSEEALLKALSAYVNRSKRKTADKRAFAKTAVLEIANANGLALPMDLSAAIDSLDDEQTEPKNVTVNGNYNDIHDNGGVNLNK